MIGGDGYGLGGVQRPEVPGTVAASQNDDSTRRRDASRRGRKTRGKAARGDAPDGPAGGASAADSAAHAPEAPPTDNDTHAEDADGHVDYYI
jgi:hypothetical protein